MAEPTHPPVATVDETVDGVLSQTGRPDTPLRRAFIQQGLKGSPTPGPLKTFVANSDHRGLLLYLLLLGKASSEPWDATLAAAVWARALGIALPNSATATSMISKTWRRLEDRRLIQRERYRRRARVFLLNEAGTGDPYTHPGQARDAYLKLPHAFWQTGPDGDRWYRVLALPEVAMLLIALSLNDGFRLPAEDMPDWYGISADTASRGLKGLIGHGLLDVRKHYKTAPLSPVGYTADHLYTLQQPFGPKGQTQKRRQ